MQDIFYNDIIVLICRKLHKLYINDCFKELFEKIKNGNTLKYSSYCPKDSVLRFLLVSPTIPSPRVPDQYWVFGSGRSRYYKFWRVRELKYRLNGKVVIYNTSRLALIQ